MKLTDNFSLKEFERSVTADANDIDNSAPDDVVSRLKILCEEVLQPVHNAVGGLVGHDSYYIRVTSGYRSAKLNELVGGSPTSFHSFGYAADCELYIKGEENNALLYQMLKAQKKYTELIWEYHEQSNAKAPQDMPKWVHVAYNKDDNRQMLKYIK